MQQGKQTLRARLQLLARLTLNAGKHTANQPARLAHLDDGNDSAILVQGNEGPAQIVRLGHRGTPSIDVSDEIAILAARPIASLCWGKPDSNSRSHSHGVHEGIHGLSIWSLLSCRTSRRVSPTRSEPIFRGRTALSSRHRDPASDNR